MLHKKWRRYLHTGSSGLSWYLSSSLPFSVGYSTPARATGGGCIERNILHLISRVKPTTNWFPALVENKPLHSLPSGGHYCRHCKIKYNIVIVGRSQQNVHYLGGVFVGHIARPLRQRFAYFNVRVFIVYDYSSSGQAIFYKSIARVKGDVSVNWVFIGINSLHE